MSRRSASATIRWILPAGFVILLAAPAQAGSCECKDIPDIEEKIEEATTAILTYTLQTALVREAYTSQGRAALQAVVQSALDAVAARGHSVPATGGTGNLCFISIDAKTACMKESVQRHEEVHREACLKDLSLSSAWTMFRDIKDRHEVAGRTMADYGREEIEAYQAELAFLMAELERLAKECKKPPPPPAPQRDYTSQPRQPLNPNAP